jgi:hypothetical protein
MRRVQGGRFAEARPPLAGTPAQAVHADRMTRRILHHQNKDL